MQPVLYDGREPADLEDGARFASDDDQRTVSALEGAANDAAKHVHLVQLTFLLTCAYLGITTASTTHEQLLQQSSMSLPILDVRVPILGFFFVAPAMLVALHFNLLLQLALLSKTLQGVRDELRTLPTKAQNRRRRLLWPLPFTHMALGSPDGGVIPALLPGVVRGTTVAPVVAVVLWMQIRSLPYHSVWLTWWLTLLVVVDVGLLVVMWPPIVSSGEGRLDWRQKARRQPLRTFGSLGISMLIPLASIGVAAEATMRLWRPGHYEAVRWHRRYAALEGPDLGGYTHAFPVPRERNPLTNFIFDVRYNTKTIIGDYSEREREETRLERLHSLILKRDLWMSNRVLHQAPPQAAQAIHTKEEQGLDQAPGRDARGLELSGRDLRGAVFTRSGLVGATLAGAQLQGANLHGAQLAGADFRGARLQGADLCEARLESANLGVAHLDNARLIGAKMREAFLIGTSLRWTDLSDADLDHAQLPHANLRGAVLEDANLRGAVLDEADLYRADLTAANLTDASLKKAQLNRANCFRANLTAATLIGAHLNRANLYLATLAKADLRATRFRQADLHRTNLRESDLRSADLTRATLNRANLRSADLSHANLRGAQLVSAVLRDASLRNAVLVDANFAFADLRGADLTGARLGRAHLETTDLRWVIGLRPQTNRCSPEPPFRTRPTIEMIRARLPDPVLVMEDFYAGPLE